MKNLLGQEPSSASLCPLSLFEQNKRKNKLIGKWEGKDECNNIGALEFIDSTRVVITIMGEKLLPMYYTVNFTENAILLNIEVQLSRARRVLQSLIHFADDENIVWHVFFESNRKENVAKETKRTAVVLKRKKQTSQHYKVMLAKNLRTKLRYSTAFAE